MVKVHQLVAAIATTITLSTTSAYALNMGSISWKSSYGQPLDARIELSDAKSLKASDIKSNIASSSDFSKAGLEYSPDLSSLSFSTIVNPDGTGYIKITSTKPIKEPFINFLVDVNWPNGKVSKEYTILLDIPETNAATPAKASNSASKPTVNNTAPQTTQASANAYKTKSGDTLWSIAEASFGKARVAKASKAIFDKNPKAFINGNINSLLNNYTLSMPTAQEVNAITVAQANAFLGSPTQEAPANTAKTSTANAKNTKQEQALQNQLQNSEKELETAKLENTTLNAELANIESEIARLEQLSKEKDEAIAKAQQAKLAAKQPEQPKTAQTQANTAQPAKTEPKAKQPTATKPASTPQPQAKTPVKPPVQTPVQQPQEEPSFISSLLDNNLMLLAGGGALLILCLAAVILRRRKAANDDTQVVDLSNVTLDDDDLQDTTPPASDSTITNNEVAASSLSQLGEGMGIIDKADIYLAYNHYDEAKELLKNALHEDPTNTELRLKLMEIYADKGDTENFEIEEQELLLLDPLSQAKIDKLKENYPAAFNDFSFSNNPTPAKEEPFASFNSVNSAVDEKKTDDTLNEPEMDFEDFNFTEPTTAPVKEEKAEPANKEIEPELHHEDDKTDVTKLIENQDINFELEKITPDAQNVSSPLFNAVIEEDFSSDSPVTAFEKEEEHPHEKSGSVKFDLGLGEHNTTENTNVDYLSEIESDNSEDNIIEKDQVTTKLELVHAYIEMGDTEGAQDLLKEIIQEGNESQKNEAQTLLSSLNLNETHTDVTNMHHENTSNDLFSPVDHSNNRLTETELELGFELPPEDEVSTKLELANAYIEMGDKQGAKDILDEVLNEGSEEQKQKAQGLLQSLN